MFYDNVRGVRALYINVRKVRKCKSEAVNVRAICVHL